MRLSPDPSEAYTTFFVVATLRAACAACKRVHTQRWFDRQICRILSLENCDFIFKKSLGEAEGVWVREPRLVRECDRVKTPAREGSFFCERSLLNNV